MKFIKKAYKWVVSDISIVLGWSVTIAWLIFIYNQMGRLDAISTLNEFGDFIAGAFAPLAFLWLVLGYYQQGKELQQNTAALQLQADELKATNETLKVQTEELQKNVEHQGQLVLINQQEVDAKHFSVLPYFEHPRYSFAIIQEDVPMYDANGDFEDTKTVDLGKLKFTFKNSGEVAKHFKMVDEETKLVLGSAIEIVKGNSTEITITLDPDEIDRLYKARSHKNTFSIIYFDQYGKEFNQHIVCTLLHNQEESHYWPSLKIFN